MPTADVHDQSHGSETTDGVHIVRMKWSQRLLLKCRSILILCGFLLKVNAGSLHITRVGQNRTYTPYMTVYLVISRPKIPCMHRIYMVLANPTYNPPAYRIWPPIALFVSSVVNPSTVFLCRRVSYYSYQRGKLRGQK